MYNHSEIEQKWQRIWEKKKAFAARDNDPRPKFYALIEFPYPSGDGLHVGHVRPHTAMDIIARKRRMEGYNVLYPIGFDSFGLPTENYAIKTGRPPAEVTEENIKNFTKQIKMTGMSFDWDRAITTSDPSYYKWTQWIFLQMFKHGLAYKKKMAINWCPSCKIGLANEEVVDGSCERCGAPVEKREKEQWMLAITKYADKLLEGLKEVDYIERAKVQQENWIGRKEGINIEYQMVGSDQRVICFTTRPDTNFGATFVVVGPEHPLAIKFSNAEQKEEVRAYVERTKKMAEAERLAENREKTGAFTGAYCVNNLNGEKMPIWISDYVLGHVGTGAVVGVPGHDLRDFEFAKKFGITIKRVVVGSDGDASPIMHKEQVQEEEGKMINSEFLDGMDIHAATKKVMDYLEGKGWGKRIVNYKLRDWVFSRQRYWGEPIPLAWCESCSKKKPKILYIYGIDGNAKENWVPWFKGEMEKKGFEVLTPELPNSTHPSVDEWLEALKKLPIDKNDRLFIVGHSMGCNAACQFVLECKADVEKLILVGPTGSNMDETHWNNLRKAVCDEESVACVKSFNDANKNLDKVKKLVKDSAIYLSKDDPFIPLSIVDNYKELNSQVKVFDHKGHFNARAGVLELPEILQEFSDGEILNPIHQRGH